MNPEEQPPQPITLREYLERMYDPLAAAFYALRPISLSTSTVRRTVEGLRSLLEDLIDDRPNLCDRNEQILKAMEALAKESPTPADPLAGEMDWGEFDQWLRDQSGRPLSSPLPPWRQLRLPVDQHRIASKRRDPT